MRNLQADHPPLRAEPIIKTSRLGLISSDTSNTLAELRLSMEWECWEDAGCSLVRGNHGRIRSLLSLTSSEDCDGDLIFWFTFLCLSQIKKFRILTAEYKEKLSLVSIDLIWIVLGLCVSVLLYFLACMTSQRIIRFWLVIISGWGGRGLGAGEQGIVDPVEAADVRDRQDMHKGIGIDLRDPFEQFRKNKSQGFIHRMKARDDERRKLILDLVW